MKVRQTRGTHRPRRPAGRTPGDVPVPPASGGPAVDRPTSPVHRAGALLLVATLTASAAPDAARPDPEPAVELRYAPATVLSTQTRDIVSCGLQLELHRTDQPARPVLGAVLRQRREGDATRVEWCARRTGAGAAGAVTLVVPGLEPLTVELPGSTAPETAQEHCRAVADASSLLFQRLFVGGGTLGVDRALLAPRASAGVPTSARAEDGEGTAAPAGNGGAAQTAGEQLTLPLERPLPVAVSRAYLNCAGDLYRPEDAR